MTDRPRPDAEVERERIVRGIRYCVTVFVGVRVGLFVVALLGTALLPALPSVGVEGWPAPPTTPGWHNLFTAWERFDALWFLRIADSGYSTTDASAVFFPLFPLATRALAFVLGGHHFAAGMLVSNAAFLGAIVVLYFLTASEWSESVARRTVLYLSIFPTSFFFVAPYSESLFLLLSVTAFWGARRDRWEVAGIAAALAAATRNVGVVLVPALIVEAVRQVQRRETRSAVRPFVWCAVAGVGTLAYLAFWRVAGGDWLAPVENQQNWQREFLLPWITFYRGTEEAFRWIGQYPGGYHLLDWLIVVPALVATGWVAVGARASYAVYVWASVLVPLSYPFAGRPFLSLPRFVVVLFPIFWGVALWAERRRGVHEVVVAASAALLGIMTVLFVTWYYVF